MNARQRIDILYEAWSRDSGYHIGRGSSPISKRNLTGPDRRWGVKELKDGKWVTITGPGLTSVQANARMEKLMAANGPLEDGKKIAVITKGWTRLGGAGWVIVSGDPRLNSISGTKKNLSAAPARHRVQTEKGRAT